MGCSPIRPVGVQQSVLCGEMFHNFLWLPVPRVSVSQRRRLLPQSMELPVQQMPSTLATTQVVLACCSSTPQAHSQETPTSGTTSSCGCWLDEGASAGFKHCTKWQMHPWESSKVLLPLSEWCVLGGSGLPKLHPGCLTVSCCCILEGDVPTIPSLETAPEASIYMRMVLT